eukprot:m51a1_g12951 putative nad-dependent epimerase (78) ;mRNA; f:486-719
MMCMDDALKTTADILEAPRSFSYVPDFHQGIAESWPQYMDDRNAREQWGWSPRFTAPDVFTDMFKNLRVKLNLNVAH